MAVNLIDSEIRKFLPFLGMEDKRMLLDKIKSILHINLSGNQAPSLHQPSAQINYDNYHFSPTAIKMDRGEVNER
jgi:hypothetical protein